MKKVFAIRNLSSGGYWDGAKNFVMYKLCKEYNTPVEAETALEKLPAGNYLIDRVFIKL